MKNIEGDQYAEYGRTLDGIHTDLDDLWTTFDDGDHADLMDALTRAIMAVQDAKELLA